MRALVDSCSTDDDAQDCAYRGKTLPRYCDALIDPSGAFYDVGPGGHIHAAYEHGLVSVHQLEREGWLHFSIGYKMGAVIVNEDELRPTQAQLDTLFDIVVAMGQGKLASWSVDVWVETHMRIINKYIKDGRDWA